MKIKDAIKKGKLPEVNVSIIFQILDNLGIRVSLNKRTEDYDIDDKLIDRVRQIANASINYSKYNNEVNNDIKTTHNALMSRYDLLIDKYTDILSKMQKDPSKKIDLDNINIEDFQDYFKSDVSSLTFQIDFLNKLKQSYDSVIKGISLTSDNLGFNSSVLSNVDKNTLKNTNRKVGETEIEIQEAEEELDKLNKMNVTSKFKQRRVDNRKRHLEERLNKLNNKKGKLQSKQTRIVNKGSDKYIEIKKREFEVLFEEAENISNYQTQMSENQITQKGIRQDIQSTQEELANLRGKKGIGATVQRGMLNIENIRLQRSEASLKKQEEKIRALNEKKGSCTLASQIMRNRANNYAM